MATNSKRFQLHIYSIFVYFFVWAFQLTKESTGILWQEDIQSISDADRELNEALQAAFDHPRLQEYIQFYRDQDGLTEEEWVFGSFKLSEPWEDVHSFNSWLANNNGSDPQSTGLSSGKLNFKFEVSDVIGSASKASYVMSCHITLYFKHHKTHSWRNKIVKLFNNIYF